MTELCVIETMTAENSRLKSQLKKTEADLDEARRKCSHLEDILMAGQDRRIIKMYSVLATAELQKREMADAIKELQQKLELMEGSLQGKSTPLDCEEVADRQSSPPTPTSETTLAESADSITSVASLVMVELPESLLPSAPVSKISCASPPSLPQPTIPPSSLGSSEPHTFPTQSSCRSTTSLQVCGGAVSTVPYHHPGSVVATPAWNDPQTVPNVAAGTRALRRRHQLRVHDTTVIESMQKPALFPSIPPPLHTLPESSDAEASSPHASSFSLPRKIPFVASPATLPTYNVANNDRSSVLESVADYIAGSGVMGSVVKRLGAMAGMLSWDGRRTVLPK